MADLRDFTKKNPIFVGTDGVRLPTGTNAQRVASANVAGTMRFNTDIDGIETYTTAGWRPLAAPPSISTVSPSTFSGESGTEFTINGEGFTPDAQVYFVTSNGTSILASTVSYYSAVQVRATTPRAIRVQEEPISVRVVQQSGTTTKTDCIDAGGVPNWITTAGTLGSIFGANTVNVYVSATDPEGTSVTYQITSGSLPGGLNFTTANGLIQGLASSVLANTTYNFTIKANDTVSNNTDRSFSYTVLNRAPVINTAAGSLGTIYSGNAASASISAYDPDGGQLTYSVSSGTLPANSSLGSANGVITGTPVVVTTNTTYSFTLTSTDEGSLTASNNYTYTVLNRPPLINTAAGSLGTIVSGNAISTTIDAYDPDGAAVSFAITSGNLMATANIGSSNGTITASNSLIVLANTTYTFTVRATDVGEMSVSNTYTYTVLNRPPLWNTAATLSAINGADPYTPITVNAYDPDGGSVTYSLTSGSVPSGLSFVTANATITGTPDEVTDNTTSTFTVTVTDPGSDANARTFSLTVTPIIDNQFSNTVLLLKTAGNTVIADASANNLPITAYGDARASNFNPFGNLWSNYFDSSTTTGFSFPQHADYSFGTGDFTVEAFIYISETNSNSNYPIAIYGWGPQGGSPASYASWHITIDSLTTLKWYRYDGGTETVYNFGSTFAQRTWYHVAITRSGTSIRGFVNGQQVGTTQTSSTSYNLVNGSSGGSDLLYVGKVGGGGAETFPGYISNFRVVKGTAVYTANTSPITSPLTAISGTALLTCQDNRFNDNSVNNAIATLIGSPRVTSFSPFSETGTSNGSMYFDGTGDYLLVDNRSEWNLSSFDWTIEFWAYPTAASQSRAFCDKRSVANQYSEFPQISLESGILKLYVGAPGGSSWLVQLTGPTILLFSWSHIAAARSGTNYYLLVNGKIVATGTGSGAQYSGSNSLCIASAATDGTNPFTGYMSNFRLVVNTAIYTANTTAPSTLLSNVAGTKLLTLQNRQPHNNHGFQDSSTGKNLITRTGNASQGTFTPFSADPGKWSGYFDGTGDRLTTPSNAAFTLGTGDYTYECWVYHTDISGQQTYFARGTAGNYNGVYFYKASSTNYIGVYYTSQIVTSSTAIEANRWYHLVACRASGTLRLFINGVQVGSSADTTNLTESIVQVGADADGSNGVKGHMSNARVIKGVALYTTNFTPSTTQLTAVTGTSLLTCQDNHFKDNSTNAFTITVNGTPLVQAFSPFAPNSAYSTANTGGSIYLDGTGDYLTIGSGTDLNLGTSDFSMEYWYYITAFGTYAPGVFCKRTGGVATGWTMLTSGFVCLVGATWYDSWATPYWVGSTASTGFNNSTSTTKLGQWTHVLLTRQGTDARWFVNGQLIGYQSRSGAIDQLTGVPLAVGFGGATSEQPFTGYISGGRISLGSVPVDYQTSSTTTGTQIFVPPTSPPTITSQNTRSNSVTTLLNFTDAAIIDYTGKNVLETVGDAKANNSVYKFSPGSMYFDGTGDYLVAPANKFYDFETGDFTIECWVRLITIGTAKMLVTSNYNAGTGAGGWALIHRADISSLSLSVNSNVTYTKSWSPTAGIWYHVSVSRSGTNLRFFIDGTQIGTTSTSSDNITGSSTVIVAGNSTSNLPIDANINDLRITKSARYTTNFTAPTRSFPTR